MAALFRRLVLLAVLGAAGFGIAYVSWAVRVQQQYDAGFAATRVGDSMADVLRRFDPPSDVEGQQPGVDPSQCTGACRTRFWYRKPLAFGRNPISVDFNEQLVVIATRQWVSP